MAASLKAIMKVQSQWDVDNTAYEAGTMLIIQYGNGTVKFKMSDNIHKFNDLAFYGDDQLNLKISNFATNTEYGINDIVMYNGDIYLANAGFTSGAAFEPADWTRAGTYYTATDVDNKLADYVTKTSVDNNVVLSFTPSVTDLIFKLTINKKNLSTGSTTQVDVELPAVTSTTRGIATPEMVGAITQHESRLNQLEGSSTRYIVDFASFAIDIDHPTQSELLDAYKATSGNTSSPPSDGTVLISEANNAIQWQYITSSTTWILISNVIPVFSKNAAGIVVGADETAEADKGKVIAGLDGKGTVNKLTEIIDDQIAIDITKLKLKNHEEQTIVPLASAPYKITSSYGSVECYGKLFIFDQQTVGKGIIRDSSASTFAEVNDLGIYAPSGTINVIHIIDKSDKSICYLINEKTQTNTLIIYPNGTYKVCDVLNLNRTPQLVTNMRLLTSMDGKRHSLFMYNSHELGTATNTAITEYILLQLEDAQLRILDASTPECSGFQGAGTFAPNYNFLNTWVAFEDESTIPDYETTARNDIDLMRGYAYKDGNNNNVCVNKRLPYKTGLWQSESGSPMINRAQRAQHNGIFGHSRGAMLLFPQDTNVQYILATPEGFIGWFQSMTVGAEYYRDWRFVELKSGPYAGKRGIIFYSINQRSTRETFIVNTPDGDPIKTVCNCITRDLTNLNHLSGKYPMAAASAAMYPNNIYTDYHRIHISTSYNTSYLAAAERLWHYYINQKDIQANTYTLTNNKYIFGKRNFDICCIDCRLDTNQTASTWHPGTWHLMDRVDWAVNPTKEINNIATLYRGNRVKKVTFLQNTVATQNFGIKINSVNTRLVVYVRSNGAVYVYTGLATDYTDSTVENGTTIKIFDGSGWASALTDVDVGNGITASWDDGTNTLTFNNPLTVFDNAIGIRAPVALNASFTVTLVSHTSVDPKAMTGTLVHGPANNCTLFIPDAAETWDGTFGIRPYFIQHQDNEATTIDGYSYGNVEYRKHSNRTAVWNNQFFMGFLNGTTGTAFIRSFYFDFASARFLSRKVNFASAACEMAPVVIDDRVMLILPNTVALNRVVGLVRNDSEIGYSTTDGGNFLFPAAYSNGPMFQRPPTTGELTTTPGITGITYIFDQITSRNIYYRFSYIDNADGTISQPTIQSQTSFWTQHNLPGTFITKYMIVMPNGRLLLFPTVTGTVAYSLPPELSGGSVALFNENNIVGYIYDITNTQNIDESSFGCYALVPQGQTAYFYTLEYNESDISPVATKWFKRATANSRIWALPYGDNNGTPIQRFLLGSSTGDVASASNPGTIIERIGGKIDLNNQSPFPYTRVRDFGTTWNPTNGSNGARVDLAVAAKKWYEPHLVPFDNSTVRFLAKKTPTQADTYTQFQNPMLMGYTYDASGNPTPFYGIFDNKGTSTIYGPELEYADEYIVEIGLTPNRDSMIYMNQNYGYALKLADGWKAHTSPSPVEFSVGSRYSNENVATIWGSYGTGNNYLSRGPYYVIIENKIVGSSPVTGHLDGQFTHEWISSPYLAPSAANGWGPGSAYAYGYSGFEPIIRDGKIAFRDNSLNANLANWSSNCGLVIINPNINLPYATLTAAQYTAGRGAAINTFFGTASVTPLFQIFDNQILPGIYRRRNNQDLNPNSTNAIVPYLQFTNEKMDMIYKDIKNVAWVDPDAPKPFYDEIRMSNVIEEHYNSEGFNWRYKTRESYDVASGDTALLCYYTENGVSKYREAILPAANEYMTRLTYLNGYMVMAGVSKIYKISMVDGTVIKDVTTPDVLSVISFDIGTDLYTFHSNDDSNLYEFTKQALVLDYDGNSYYVIPLKDLNIVGNNTVENLAVTNQFVASYGRIATLEADQIYVKSKFIPVIIP
jgi:hypothetical protein